jgi:membrane protease YdiL (CAAX protease family)
MINHYKKIGAMKHWLTTTGFDKKEIHTYILLLSAPVLLTIYRYHAYPGFFTPDFDFGIAVDQNVRVNQFIRFFGLFFVLPTLYIKLVMKRPLKDFGLGLGDYILGLKILAVLIPVIFIAIYFAAGMPDVRTEYPLAKSLMQDQTHIWFYELAYIIFYYIAWEFYFRGVLLFGLKDRFGVFNAILIQTISSCLVHIGKPEGEIIGSIIVGIIFGMIAYRTRSIWYVFILHALIGVLTDLFIIYL